MVHGSQGHADILEGLDRVLGAQWAEANEKIKQLDEYKQFYREKVLERQGGGPNEVQRLLEELENSRKWVAKMEKQMICQYHVESRAFAWSNQDV